MEGLADASLAPHWVPIPSMPILAMRANGLYVPTYKSIMEATFLALSSSVRGTLLGFQKKGTPLCSAEAISKEQAPSSVPRRGELGLFANSFLS